MNYANSSGKKSASAQISTFPGTLCGLDLTNPDSGQVLLTVWDSENTTTTDKLVLCHIELDAGLQAMSHNFFPQIIANRGLYAELTFVGGGTQSNYVIRFTIG